MSVYEITLLLNGEQDREERIREAFDKVAEINGAALKRLADSDDLIEHNGKQYRKVKRKAAVGELVVVTKTVYANDYDIGDIFEVINRQTDRIEIIDNVGDGNALYDYEYYVLELVEQSGQLTEHEIALFANLAQEVAELKRQLTNAKTDIAYLEDRVDENEKDTEGLKKQSQSPAPWALEGDVIELNSRLHLNEKYTEELIGRMNDLGDGVKEPRHKRSNLISELERRRHEALCKRNRYEDMGDEGNYRYFDGKMVGLIEVIGIVEEALRND